MAFRNSAQPEIPDRLLLGQDLSQPVDLNQFNVKIYGGTEQNGSA